ncbi:MAG TPA: Gfo/Idh/MocA family oxidoreductase [Planctomycetaceae bacterium]|nr:Gfo/Idh/MocA family oxidoreductase [Planctomycetaceae bacterium]
MALRTRREFLEESLMAATAAALAGTVAAPTLVSAAKAASGPNDVLRVAILGVNGRGQDHLSGFLRRQGCEVVAICDPDEKVGQTKGVARVEKETGKKPAYYQDLRQVMDDPNIDIVTIATPNHWHSLAAIWALQAGKDVYVEKPVSHNVSEGRRVVEMARKHNRICQAGTQCRSMQGSINAIDYVRSGKIGDVKLARGLCYKSRGSIGARGKYPVPEGIDYNLWLGPAPMADVTRPRFHYDWHWQWDYGNGDLGNQGIHQMDVARWGLGVNDIGASVVSFGGRFAYEDAGDTANTQVSVHHYGDKTLIFEVRGLATDALQGAKVGNIFYGSNGYVVLTSYDGGAAFDRDGKLLETFKGGGDHYGNFVDAVRARKNDLLRGEILEGHLSSALCHLGNISYRLAEPISFGDAKAKIEQFSPKAEVVETFERFTSHLQDNKVDLASVKLNLGPQLPIDAKTERFTGEMAGKANPMLTREYRAPFVVPDAV